MIAGIILNSSGLKIPLYMVNVLNIFVSLALPIVLISLGLALGNFQIRSNINSAIILTILKNLIHPVLAFCISKFILNLK